MKKLFALSKRNIKEMLRDPLSLVFCIAFPVLMLVMMQIIFKNVEYMPENYEIKNYAAGICVFGYAFTGLFVALQITGDKSNSFIKRINISPILPVTYLLSFLVSALPVTFVQTILFYAIALIFGFPFDINLLISIFYLIPSAVMYISFGILVGSLCKNEKQTGPITSIFISLAGIFGGVFMPLSSFKGGFAEFVNLLPFAHSVSIASQLPQLGAACIYPHILFLIGYIAVAWIIIFVTRKIKN